MFGIGETKLKKQNRTFRIEGYQTPFRKDTHTHNGGGLLVYVKKGINVKRRGDLETNEYHAFGENLYRKRSNQFKSEICIVLLILGLNIMIDLKTLWTQYFMRGRK